MIIKTHLVSGAGNTFHIAYGESWNFSTGAWTLVKMKAFAKTVCETNKADGFIFLEKNSSEEKSAEHYKWYFFNNDGSDAEMCGNATRCVGFYIKNILNNDSNSWRLITAAGLIQIDFVTAEKYKITMTPAQVLKSDKGFYCDTGVPHLVIEKNNITLDENLLAEAKALRQHVEFSPRGTNVTFLTLEEDTTRIKAVSYERGVENFTAACGTGAMAAALYNLAKRGEKQTQVEMPGGTLMMDLSDLSRPTMTGPAALLGSYNHEV